MDIAHKIVEELKPIFLDLKRPDELTIQDVVSHEILKALQARYDEKAAIFNDFYQKSSYRNDAWDSMQEIGHIALGMDINLKLRETP